MRTIKHQLSRFILVTLLCTTSSYTFAQSIWDGIKKDDPNPGLIPETVLEEVSALELKNLGGHKVFAGQNKIGNASHAYLNIDFACDGTAKFEAYPKSNSGGPAKKTEGIYEWTLRDDHARVNMNLVEFTEGKFFMNDKIKVDVIPTSGSSLVVGQGALRNLIVSRIIRHTDCDNTADKVEGLSPTFYKNPGDIPKTIIAELTSLDLPNLGGHKIFAGPDEERLAQYLYFNVDFNCDGTGRFEAYPPFFEKGSTQALLFKITKGTFNWTVRKDKQQVELNIVDFTEGRFISQKEISVSELERQRNWGTVVAGVSDVENRYVSRIVQHTDCGS